MTSLSSPSEGTKVILHWLNKSRSQRILFLLEELHVPYEIRTYERTADKVAPPELKQVHPLGKSPVVEIQVPGRSEPIILAESALIIEYICEYWGKQLIPARWKDGQSGGIGQESEAWMRYKYYMNYGEGSLMPFLVMKLVIGSKCFAPCSFTTTVGSLPLMYFCTRYRECTRAFLPQTNHTRHSQQSLRRLHPSQLSLSLRLSRI